MNIVPLPNLGVVGRMIDNEAILVLPCKGEVKMLNKVGGCIWSLIDGQRNIKGIVATFMREFNVKQSEVRVILEISFSSYG